jgi:hypothetical protein
MLSDRRLSEIKARADAATPGPWTLFIEGRDHYGGSSFIRTASEDIEPLGATDADQDFMASARQDVPDLLAEIERLKAQGTR